jgi:mevalonate pyrophosphate decarboxylase
MIDTLTRRATAPPHSPVPASLFLGPSGYAALVFGLAKLFCAKEEYEGQLSAIARQGSGSACRSLYGGLVRYAHRQSAHKIAQINKHEHTD